MASEFLGTASPLSATGFANALAPVRATEAALWAVLNVETNGCGFLADRRPVILFERHIFSRHTRNQFDRSHPHISHPIPGGYGMSGPNQYDRLEQAIELHRTAALASASWGIGQIMGFNFAAAGYQDVEEMVAEMMDSEDLQLLAMTTFIATNNWGTFLANNDWVNFAKSYNGPSYSRNSYDAKLASAYRKYATSLPDVNVRTAQMYLRYLGNNPGAIDGIAGNATYVALHEFQRANHLLVSNTIDDNMIRALRTAVANL